MSGSLPVAVTRMTFDDEFNSFVSSADGSAGWMTSFPYGGEAAYTLAGNNEAEYYGSSASGLNPFSLQNGVLSITATPANGSNPYGLPYNSGLITTDKSFSQTYGYFEVNAKLPSGQGLWPAFWLLPASNVYTSELDVFEQLGNAPSTIYSTVHGSTNGVWASNSQAFTVANTAAAFHTYGVDWEPATTTYYVDGVAIGSAPTPSSMDSPMFLLLNLAVGGTGSWPGALASTSELPASLQINYVHAYATAGTTFVGGTDALPVSASTPPALVIDISEDAWIGDAQYTVSVDGVQQGGVLTASAAHAAGATQAVSIAGTWGAGAHTVAITFLNDAYGGSASRDRNLYVDGVTLNGSAAGNAPAALLSDGTTTFTIAGGAAATVPASVVTTASTTSLGTGPDTLALVISEDAYLGDARFTVSINGVQQGGTLTASAGNATPLTPLLAQSQVFDLEGSFTGSNVVTVNFLNDLYGGSIAADRNLFVLGATIDGTAVANSTLNEFSGGPQTFVFTEPTATAPIVGTGPDTLALSVSEDAYLGNAQFTVSVNGVQQNGILTATVTNAAANTPELARSQVFDIKGSFTSSNVVTVNFLNDLYGGSAVTDRNLFVLGASIDGNAIAGSALTEDSTGPQSFSFTEPVAPISAATTGAASATALVLNLSEDAYLGDAQFTVAVDGVQLAAAQAVTTLHGSGTFQAFGFTDLLSAGSHDVAVSFLNDLYGGSVNLDRNLYVTGATVNGVSVGGAASTLLSAGTNHFSITV